MRRSPPRREYQHGAADRMGSRVHKPVRNQDFLIGGVR